ncbi:hypothetical protein [Crassaminicella profunda]|uniref:hypothetical protein n=1 Tax=Crassaminicella profunda TaxID=1286698 RepID=UPI001CA604CB|nr:hypothetical protein [Crassaminicella profunda]QZY56617.1 hypothetical protein K7H06_06780 [Crassaminicella profunda]
MKINHGNYNFGFLGKNNQELKVGQMIKGKIQQILNDVLILELENGKLLEAKTNIPIEAQKNSILQFQVKSIYENQITIQPMIEELQHKEEISTAEKKIIDMLKALNIKSGEEEVELVKKLIVNEIPVNKENLENIIQSKTSFEKMETLLNDKSIISNEKMLNENIREVLKNLLNVEDVMKENESSNPENAKKLATKDSNLLEMKKNIIEKVHEELFNGKIAHSKNINVHNMNFEKIIFLLKNNLKLNISNVTNINNLLLNDFTITKQMDELVGALYKNEETISLGKSLENIFSNIKNMILEKKFEPVEIMKEIHIKLELAKQSIENISSKDKGDILNNITNLKNSLEFVDKLNQFQTYFQIPIFLDDEKKNLDLYISKNHKNKKKINPKDVKILVALDTKTMEKIQVLIEIKDKNITCNFKVKTDEIKKKLLAFENDLKETLKLLEFKGITTKYVVSNIEKNIIDEDFNKKEMTKKIRFIDLKV